MDLSSVMGQPYAAGNATRVVFDSSGRLLVGGGGGVTGEAQPFVLRLTSAGEPDISFNEDGLAFNDLPSRTWHLSGLAIQPDGAIVFAGTAKDLVDAIDEAMVGRFLAKGAPDISLGGTGITSVDVGLASAVRLALQSDGAIVLAARLVHTGLGETHIGAVRFVGDDPCTVNGTSGPGQAHRYERAGRALRPRRERRAAR